MTAAQLILAQRINTERAKFRVSRRLATWALWLAVKYLPYHQSMRIMVWSVRHTHLNGVRERVSRALSAGEGQS